MSPTRVNHEALHPGIGNNSCSSGTRQRTSAADTYANREVENTPDYCISRVLGTVHTAVFSCNNALPRLVQASCEEIRLIGNFNQKFASRLTRRKVDMGLADAFGRERVLRVNVDPQDPTRYQSPELRAITVTFFKCHQIFA
jgi:hypothetical protein